MNDDNLAGIPCNLCGGVDVSVLSRRSRSGKPLRTVGCRRCGLVWSDPRPHDPRKFYEEQYRLAYKRTLEPRPRHVLRAGKVALSRHAIISPYLQQARMRILEVGSGGGEFAYLLKSLGHEVHGVEPNRGYAAYAASEYGLHVFCGFIANVQLPDEHYDLITTWHVLEHTEDPTAVLGQLKRALRRDGVLVVEVPNVEATCQSPDSTFHEAHLFNFNAATLGLLGAKVGLYPCLSQLTPDGGNVTAVFRGMPVEQNASLPGNHDQIAAIVRWHAQRSRWLSSHPYRRLAHRISRLATEWLETRHPAGGRERLNDLYAPLLLRRPAYCLQGAAKRENRLSWKTVLVTYLMALLLEWLLLDGTVHMENWTGHEALLAYTALQSAVVVSVVRMKGTPAGIRELARYAAWAAPLFALPAMNLVAK